MSLNHNIEAQLIKTSDMKALLLKNLNMKDETLKSPNVKPQLLKNLNMKKEILKSPNVKAQLLIIIRRNPLSQTILGKPCTGNRNF